MALPGTYSVQLSKVVDGVETPIGEAAEFDVVPLDLATFAAADKVAVDRFYREVSHTNRVVQASLRVLADVEGKLGAIHAAILATPKADSALLQEHEELRARTLALRRAFTGDSSLSSRSAPAPLSIARRIGIPLWGLGSVTSPPTQTWRDCHDQVKAEMNRVYPELKTISEVALPALEGKLQSLGHPGPAALAFRNGPRGALIPAAPRRSVAGLVFRPCASYF